MSGGVDSTVAAALLQEEGYEVIGLWMQVLGEGPPEEIPSFRDALSSAQSIGIPLFPVDLRAPFQVKVIDYFLQEYLAGRTPNPCALCNPRIKFGPLMEWSVELGAESFATGHYARPAGTPRRNGLSCSRGSMRRRTSPISSGGWRRNSLPDASSPTGTGAKSRCVNRHGNEDSLPLSGMRARRYVSSPTAIIAIFCRGIFTVRIPPAVRSSTKRGVPWGGIKGSSVLPSASGGGSGSPHAGPITSCE